MSGCEHAFAQVVEHYHASAPPSRRNAFSCRSAQVCALDRNTSRRTDFRLWPSVMTNSRVRRYLPVFGSRTIGPVAVIDLGFLVMVRVP